jgi:hypothetical protein
MRTQDVASIQARRFGDPLTSSTSDTALITMAEVLDLLEQIERLRELEIDLLLRPAQVH